MELGTYFGDETIMRSWLVMRCGSNNTMPLVKGMAEHEVDCWTPLWWRKARQPRSSIYKKTLLPCLPSFIFLNEGHSEKAFLLQGQVGISFSFMRSNGTLVRINDHHLNPLRKLASLSPQHANPVPWPRQGARQRVVSGAFEGMFGKVVGRTDKHCLIELEQGNMRPVKIPPFLLSDIEE